MWLTEAVNCGLGGYNRYSISSNHRKSGMKGVNMNL